jgi:F-type H+-transporting ATPase subunit b
MLELDPIWFFVQIGNFFLLLFILNKILYKPLLNLIDERKKTIKTLYDEVRQMEDRQRELAAQITNELALAHQKGRIIFNSLRDTGLTRQKALVFEAEQAVIEMNEQMLKDIKHEIDEARSRLRSQIEPFSREIIKKITES